MNLDMTKASETRDIASLDPSSPTYHVAARLEANLDQLSQACFEIERRLSPVLRHSNAGADGCQKAEPSEGPLADHLSRLADSVCARTSQLRELIDRLSI